MSNSEKGVNQCERCFETIKDEEVSLVLFYKDFVPENKAEELKKLCHDCYELVKHTSTPDSWCDPNTDISYAKMAQKI